MEIKNLIDQAYASLLDHDFEKAIEWFQKAVESDPDNPTYHYKLSITYARSNKLESALFHAGKAAKLDPGDETYRFHLRHLRARELASQAEKLLDREERNLRMAVVLLQRAVQADPLLVKAHLLLALAYTGLGDHLEALQAVREAVRLDPSNETAKAMLGELSTQISRRA